MKARNKLLSLGGMLMMGDALAYSFGRKRHIEAWRGHGRTRPYTRFVDWIGQHRGFGAAITIAEAIAGAALVRRAEAR